MTIDPVEWSHPFEVAQITATPLTLVLTPDDTVRAALARRFDLVAIDRLEARLTVKRVRAGRLIAVTGSVAASVVQTCVVTLEPFAATVHDEVDLRFVPEATVAAAEVSVEGLDDPEPLDGPLLDLGEVAAQALSLALDPHPRAPGVAFLPIEDPEDEAEAEGNPPSSSPFAALRARKPAGEA